MVFNSLLGKLTVLLVLSGAFLLSGCATTLNGPVHAYPGKPRSLSELAEIRIPPGINLIAVDSVEYKHGEAGPEGVPLYLTPGRHQVAVNYSEVYGDPTAASLYTSDTFIFTPDVRAGETYRFAHNGPEDPTSADVSTADVEIWLLNTRGGQRLQAARRVPAGGILSQLGVTPSPIVVAPAAPAMPAPAPAPAAPMPAPARPAAGGTVLDELRNWWQQASPAERAEFRKWIVDHP